MSIFDIPHSSPAYPTLLHSLRLLTEHATLLSLSPSSLSPPTPLTFDTSSLSIIPSALSSRRSSFSSVSAEDCPRRLSDVNEDIKRTLTSLLRFNEVRGNGERRMWVQRRLMEAERELRAVRRRSRGGVGAAGAGAALTEMEV